MKNNRLLRILWCSETVLYCGVHKVIGLLLYGAHQLFEILRCVPFSASVNPHSSGTRARACEAPWQNRTNGTCEITNLPFHALWADTSPLLSLYIVHLVDIWNVIEALRENALNNVDPNMELNVARLEAVLSTIFYQLNKRMPTTHQIQVEQSISLLLNFLLAAFDP